MLSKAGNKGATPFAKPLEEAAILGFCLASGPWETIYSQYSDILRSCRVKNSFFYQIPLSQWQYVIQEGVFKAAWEAFQERGERVRRVAKVEGFEWGAIKAKGLLLIPIKHSTRFMNLALLRALYQV